ncbi:MAG: hypothetical protein R3234_10910 [Thermoanaerobaculia bacterium]|nr:hypothetical protein [Thermoanaerobaculia bacterium]
MEVFEIKSGSLAVGDPTVGLVELDLGLEPGFYRLAAGALIPAVVGDSLIDLTNPYLFAVDASVQEEVEDWFEEVGEECSYQIRQIIDRLPELEEELGIRVSFYWETDLAGLAREGQYRLNENAIEETEEPAPEEEDEEDGDDEE